jgi:hypothetical protein
MAGKNKMSSKMQKLAENILKSEGTLVKANRGANPMKNLPAGIKEIVLGKIAKKMNMGGEVMDTTKSMPVGMMDGGKVKPMKMNMGGVVPGRGGKFKGVR